VPVSNRLKQLIVRIKNLETHLLPTTFSLTGKYSARQSDLTKAFLILVHAELESFLEDRAEKRVALAESQWKRNGLCTPVMSRLLLYHQATEKRELQPISPHAVAKAVNYYVDKLRNNNGIKERNLLSILLPLGISHADLGSQLVAACNQLAFKRGQFAHASFKTHQQIDPKTERDNIRENIIPELKKLDVKIKRLK
jgi:hypothetical protein